MKKLIGFLFLCATVRLLAVNPVPFTEGMGFSFKIDGTGAASINLYDETGTQYVLAYSNGTTIESDVGTAWMVPGKSYTLQFWGLGPPNYTMSFIAPTGYSVFVNGVATNLVSQSPGTGWHLEYYTVELRPQVGEFGGMWGQFSGIALGKAISWGVGLGDLRTGRSAGGIQFKKPDLSGNPASRDQLYYAAPPANVGQIVVIKDGASNQTLRQIVTPIGFTDIVDVSGGYEIRCYFWNQAASWNGTIYTFSGSPWKTIKVESPANNQLKITETEGSVVRVSNLVGTGCMGVTGGTISNSGSYTIHTFNSSGTLGVLGSLSSVDYLVVGGGGGGGGYTTGPGGGGGAGSMEIMSGQTLSAGAFSVTVGAGGIADTNGGNSVFNGTTAYGGGHGGNDASGGVAGGSGGGGVVNNNTGAPASTGKQGANTFYGGSGDNGGHAWEGGGGGGAGGAGHGVGEGASTGLGGSGLSNSYSGSAVTYAAGGSGAINTNSASGIGGAGGNYTSAGDGAANTGSGGGGAFHGTTGKGGSGVVVIRYPSASVGNYTWTLQEGDATTIARTTVHTFTVPASGQRDDVVAVYKGNSTSSTDMATKTKYHYVTQAWGEELDSIIADPDTAALTTSYVYYTNSANLGNYRRVQSVTTPTGGWTVYQYYDDWDRRGQLQYQIQPWLDSPTLASSASTTTGHVIYYQDYVADWTGRHTRPTVRQEFINNTLVGQTTWSHGDNTGSGEPRAYATINSYRDGTNYQSDYVESYRADADPDFAGQAYQSKAANLAQASVSISRGTFNVTTKAFAVGSSGDHWRQLKFNGSTSGTGAESVTSFDSQSCPGVYMIPNKSTLEVTIRIAQGYVYRTETWVYTGSGTFSLMTAEDFEYDATGHLTQRWASTGNGALTGYVYANGRLTSVFDPTGTETQSTYDAIGRVATSIKKGASASGSYAAQGDITTTYTYDGAGHVTQTVSSGGSLSQTATSVYDLAGRLTSSTAPGGYTTGYAYSAGGKIVTSTLPGGATQISEVYPDGQAKSTTGSAVVAQYSTYSRDGTSGNITRQVNANTPTSANLVKTTTDWLGRAITEVRPGWNGSDVTTTNYYNSSGQLYRVSRPGMADTLYSYDTLGGLFRECLDVGANGTIDLASSDRITEHGWTFFLAGGTNWWRRETTSTYATTGSGTATQVGKAEVQLSGLATNRLSLTNTTDIYGNVTSQFVDVDRSGKKVYTTTDAPNSTTDAVQIAYNGLLVSAKDITGKTMTYGYDALGRQTTSVDPRTGTTTTAYVTGTSQILTVTDAASVVQATYAYDSAGRVKSVMDAFNKFTYYAYTPRNEKFREWGDTTVPVEYGYDDWGHQATMSTYRAGTGWTQPDWPGTGANTGNPGIADVTKWNYQEATGLLSSKVSAYGTADARTVSYTYTQAGQMLTRAAARLTSGTTHVTTTYAYDSGTGELTGVTYNDGTASLAYTYNRLGKQATVTDPTGTRTLNYNLAGTLEQQNEDLPSFFGTRRITYGYDTATGVIGRPNALQLGTSGSPAADQSIAYGYDSGTGRLTSVAAGGQTFTYGYQASSNLIAAVTNTAANYTDTRTYDPHRDWVTDRKTQVSTTIKAEFAYTVDNLGRITQSAKTGELYNRYGNGAEGLKTNFGYDDRSQVTSEQTKVGASTTTLTGRDDTHAYDTIGNRSSTTHNGRTATYTTNAVNEYTQRTVPGYFDVAGAAGSGTTVTVAKSGGSTDTATRHGQYFFDAYALTNTSAVSATLTVSDGTTPVNLAAFLSATPEPFVYDLDGNLTSDGRWDYVYDAENRLLSMQTHVAFSPVPIANADAQRLEFNYDYLGRRVEKLVRGGYNGTIYTTVVTDEKAVWNGWMLMARLNAASGNALIASHYWGVDISGSVGGAGGVGGLLMTQDSGSTYMPAYDAMGNVHGMIKASDGTLAAAYEYDAFGQTLRESGTYAAANPFRFSTKYTDVETSLVYYGLRYYSPSLGRFINKDPLEEQGGLNLYGFCRNNPINKWDHVGLFDVLQDLFNGSVADYNAWKNSSYSNLQPGDTNGSMNDIVMEAFSGDLAANAGALYYGRSGSGLDEAYTPTISYNQATMDFGNRINGGDQVTIGTLADGSQRVIGINNSTTALAEQRTTVAEYNAQQQAAYTQTANNLGAVAPNNVALDPFTATGQKGLFGSQSKADARFTSQVNTALNQARSGLLRTGLGLGPDAQEALDALGRLDNALGNYKISVKETSGGNAGGGLYQNRIEVNWNPSLTVTVGGVNSAPYLTLLHELTHGIDAYELPRTTADFLRNAWAGPMSNLWEMNAMKVENLARPPGSPNRTVHDPSKTW